MDAMRYRLIARLRPRPWPALPLRRGRWATACTNARDLVRHDAGHVLGPFAPFDDRLRYPEEPAWLHNAGVEAACLGCGQMIKVEILVTRSMRIISPLAMMVEPCPRPMVRRHS